MISRSSACLLLTVLASAITPLASAQAADLGSAPPALPTTALSGWTLTVTPYGWGTWLDGTVTVKGRSADVSIDPIQLIDHLERVPFMGYAEARKGPFGLYGDLFYADIGLNASAVHSRSLNPAISGTLSRSLGLDIEETILELGGAYQVLQRGPTALDLIAGARYWHQDADLKLALTATLDTSDLFVSRGVAVARSGSVDWVDPLVGARIRHELAPGQELLLRGDVGGFGAGSQFSWNILAAYSLKLCDQKGVTYSGVLGYRLLDVDFVKGSGRTRYEYDVLMHGPLLGLSIAY